MAAKPSLDRSDLESKTREDLQTIAKVKGVDVSARASKSSLIEAIMGEDPAPTPVTTSVAAESGTRVVRSRRTVTMPNDDFDDLVSEFVSDTAVAPASAPADEAPTSEAISVDESPSENGAERPQARERQNTQPRTNQPREFGNEQGGRNRRNRRNRNGTGSSGPNSGRERFGGEAQPNADQPYSGELIEVEGLLDLRDDGYGFLRTKGFHPSPNDVYVSINQVRRYHLRKGDTIVGGFRPAASNEKYPALLRVDTVAGVDPEVARLRPRFEDLTPLFPDEKLKLETNEGRPDPTPRIVDLLAPIGKGQRGLIVSPPKAGKTTVMKQIAQSIEANNPEVHLMVLLVDERPEEVTDMRRSVKGEIIASTFDRPAEEHTHLAELCIERAKRLVEQGRDVVIILESITRLARAYNLAAPATGRIMSGGVDSGALYPPKKFFGAARNIEEGGSLTILATALVDTGSKMDDVIYEEFKGTGNSEIHLDRRISEKRVFPAVNINRSGTRKEELITDQGELAKMWILRKLLHPMDELASIEFLLDKMKDTKSNGEFFEAMKR
jgi:transcription termination factor Rho